MFGVPCLHPAFLMRQRARMWGLFDHAVARAIRIADGTWAPNWREDEFIVRPSADAVVKALKKMHGKRVAYDVETDGRHPLECTLRCLAFYDGNEGICIPFVFRDGSVEEVPRVTESGKIKIERRSVWKPYFTGKALAKVVAAIKKLLASSKTRFESQNGQYDRTVLGAYGFEVPRGPPHFDTILGHHIIASYLPHGLNTLAALYTECPYYKQNDDGDSWSSESDMQLWRYNIRDVKVTWLIAKKMREEVTFRAEDQNLYDHDAWQEGACEDWKRIGILLSPETLAFFRQHYRAVAVRALEGLKRIAATVISDPFQRTDALQALLDKWSAKDEEGVDDEGKVVEYFNPGSLIQLRALLIALGVPLNEVTATGQLSTAKEFLTAARKELLERQVPPDDDRLAFLDYLFAWRESTKVESTYLHPEVLRDGRVHPTFNNFVVPTGRLNSKAPNFQNQPADIRGMFIPRPGHVFVYGDWDALEMRLAAFISGDPELIKVFADYDAKRGPKPHIVNMAVIFGLPATKEAAEQNPGMYRAAKVFAYAVAYGAGDQTVFEQVREELPDMSWDAFQIAIGNYRRKYKVMFDYFKNCVKRGTQVGYLDSAILKRRVYFFERGYGDGNSPEASAMQNMPMQSGGADVVSLANRRIMKKVVEPMRKKLKKNEVLEQLAQVHDELLFEVPRRMAKKFAHGFETVAKECPAPGFESWYLPVEVKSADRWKPVQTRCRTRANAESPICGQLVNVEPVKRTKTHVHWEGTCEKCKQVSYIEVERKLEALAA